MKFDCDPAVDALYVKLSESAVVESEEVQSGIILDFDDAGIVVGVVLRRFPVSNTPI